MKNMLIGSIAVFATFAFAGTAFCQFIGFEAQANVSGSAKDDNGIIPTDSFTSFGDVVTDPHFATDSNGDSVGNGDATAFASSTESAGLGNLHVEATAG